MTVWHAVAVIGVLWSNSIVLAQTCPSALKGSEKHIIGESRGELLAHISRSAKFLINSIHAQTIPNATQEVIQERISRIDYLTQAYLIRAGIDFRVLDPATDQDFKSVANRNEVFLLDAQWKTGSRENSFTFQRKVYEVTSIRGDSNFAKVFSGMRSHALTKDVRLYIDPLMSRSHYLALYHRRGRFIRMSLSGLRFEMEESWRGVLRHEFHHALSHSRKGREGNLMHFFFRHEKGHELPAGYEHGFWLDEIDAYLRDLRLHRVRLRQALQGDANIVRYKSELLSEVIGDLNRLRLFVNAAKSALRLMKTRFLFHSIFPVKVRRDLAQGDHYFIAVESVNGNVLSFNSSSVEEFDKFAMSEVDLAVKHLVDVESELMRTESEFFPNVGLL
jgi:hypothetical protein